MNNKKIVFVVASSLDYNIRVYKTLRTLSNSFEILVFHFGETPLEFKNKISNTTFITVPEKSLNFFSRTSFLGNSFNRNFDFIKNSIRCFGDFDYVFAVDLWTLPLAVKIKKAFGGKLIYDSYEICVETISQHFPMDNYSLKSVFFRIWTIAVKRNCFFVEKHNIKLVDLFITTNSSYLNHFKSKYEIKRSCIVMNCPETHQPTGKMDLHSLCNLDKNKRIVLYLGTFNEGRGLLKIHEIAKLCDSSIHFVLMGTGILQTQMEKLYENNPSISLLGSYKMKETIPIIRGADITLFLLENSNLSKWLSSANKVFDFMAAQKTGVISSTPENQFIVEKTSAFELTDVNDYKRSAEKIEFLLADDNIRKRHQRNGYNAFVNSFNWEKQEEILLDSINSL